MLPVLLILGGVGVYKLFDANDKSNRADAISADALQRFQDAQRLFEKECQKLSERFDEFSRFKVNIVDHFYYINTSLTRIGGNAGRVLLKNMNFDISETQLEQIKYSLPVAHSTVGEITGGVLKGLITQGAIRTVVTQVGVRVGLAEVAGAVALESLALPVGILIAGLSADSKAEKRLTEATNTKAKVDIALAEIENSRSVLKAIHARIQELQDVIIESERRFETIKSKFQKADIYSRYNLHNPELQTLLVAGTQLKNLLEIPIINTDGTPIDQQFIKLRIKEAQQVVEII